MYLLICVSVNTKEIEIAFFLKKAVSHQKQKKGIQNNGFEKSWVVNHHPLPKTKL